MNHERISEAHEEIISTVFGLIHYRLEDDREYKELTNTRNTLRDDINRIVHEIGNDELRDLLFDYDCAEADCSVIEQRAMLECGMHLGNGINHLINQTIEGVSIDD